MHFLALLIFVALTLSAAATAAPSLPNSTEPSSPNSTDLRYEYIIVGSGAGGGVLAARLAEAGKSVLLIESGDDQGGNLNYTIPAFTGKSTQDEKMRWDMFVSHYQDLSIARKDPKFVYDTPGGQYIGLNPPYGAVPKGILYPRAGSLGGCTTHNALIWILPHASDWNGIAQTTGDASWSYENMLKYYSKVHEWQHVQAPNPGIMLNDKAVVAHLAGTAVATNTSLGQRSTIEGVARLLTHDPNNITNPNRDAEEGVYHIPLITKNGTRVSVRERLVLVASKHPNLTIRQNCLVTRVIFDTSSGPRAIGVEFLDGKHLYRASPLSGGTGSPGKAMAMKEVILAGGAFNTPQLLKLSGIGPADELKSFDIPVVKDLPGVGTNLQDRYEVPVNVRHNNDLAILNGCTFTGQASDPCLQQWENNPDIFGLKGLFTTNLRVAAAVQHSATADNSDVDLIISAGVSNFQGYFPGWPKLSLLDHKHFSTFILKAHTRNKAGTVKLASKDPRDQPRIDFNYFDPSTEDGGDEKDLAALAEAIQIARESYKHYYDFANSTSLPADSFVEELPGPGVNTTAQLEEYVKTYAWGHHASCSCPMGANNNRMAVVDSLFRVRGVHNLRVVDASVFPKIPGTFIQAPIFIMAEKAAEVILRQKGLE